MKSVRFSQSLL